MASQRPSREQENGTTRRIDVKQHLVQDKISKYNKRSYTIRDKHSNMKYTNEINIKTMKNNRLAASPEVVNIEQTTKTRKRGNRHTYTHDTRRRYQSDTNMKNKDIKHEAKQQEEQISKNIRKNDAPHLVNT